MATRSRRRGVDRMYLARFVLLSAGAVWLGACGLDLKVPSSTSGEGDAKAPPLLRDTGPDLMLVPAPPEPDAALPSSCPIPSVSVGPMDFSAPPKAPWHLQGDAKLRDKFLRLTERDRKDRRGSLWLDLPEGFRFNGADITFRLRVEDRGGFAGIDTLEADGLAFLMLRGPPTSLADLERASAKGDGLGIPRGFSGTGFALDTYPEDDPAPRPFVSVLFADSSKPPGREFYRASVPSSLQVGSDDLYFYDEWITVRVLLATGHLFVDGKSPAGRAFHVEADVTAQVLSGVTMFGFTAASGGVPSPGFDIDDISGTLTCAP